MHCQDAGFGSFGACFSAQRPVAGGVCRVWQGLVNHMGSWIIGMATGGVHRQILDQEAVSELSAMRRSRIRRSVGDKEKRV
jgi:hypothetical protein